MQGAGKIVSAAGGDYKYRKLEANQRGKMAMDGAVAAKDKDGLGIVR